MLAPFELDAVDLIVFEAVGTVDAFDVGFDVACGGDKALGRVIEFDIALEAGVTDGGIGGGYGKVAGDHAGVKSGEGCACEVGFVGVVAGFGGK